MIWHERDIVVAKEEALFINAYRGFYSSRDIYGINADFLSWST
jgi:hypothetical protein